VPAQEMEKPDRWVTDDGGDIGTQLPGQHLATYCFDQTMTRWSAHRSIFLLLPNQIGVSEQAARACRSHWHARDPHQRQTPRADRTRVTHAMTSHASSKTGGVTCLDPPFPAFNTDRRWHCLHLQPVQGEQATPSSVQARHVQGSPRESHRCRAISTPTSRRSPHPHDPNHRVGQASRTVPRPNSQCLEGLNQGFLATRPR
jgi:hypothetical protein